MRHHIAGIRLLTLAATIYHARSGLHRESTAFRGAGLLPISLNGLRVTNAFDAYLRRTNVSSASGATVLPLLVAAAAADDLPPGIRLLCPGKIAEGLAAL